MEEKPKEKQAIIQTYMVKEIELSELDMENRAIILGKNWDDDDKEWPYIISKVAKGAEDQFSFRGEANPVNIATLIKTLYQLKDKGCNFVEIMNHEDHQGYHINGLEIRKASPKDMANYEKSELDKKTAIAKQKIEKLQSEIEKLKNT